MVNVQEVGLFVDVSVLVCLLVQKSQVLSHPPANSHVGQKIFAQTSIGQSVPMQFASQNVSPRLLFWKHAVSVVVSVVAVMVVAEVVVAEVVVAVEVAVVVDDPVVVDFVVVSVSVDAVVVDVSFS